MNAKDAARERLEASREALIELSHRTHAHPETAFEERQACGWVAEALSAAGFAVETGICDLPTAFVARAGRGPLKLAICAEYDSLPGIGYACGHNIIAAMAAGAGIAAAKVADDVGLSINVIGTPAEEIYDAGGKHPNAKPLKGFHGAGVLEVVDDYDGNAYRAIYTVRFERMVYVLHAFQKKSTRGIETPKSDIDLVRLRLRMAEDDYRSFRGS